MTTHEEITAALQKLGVTEAETMEDKNCPWGESNNCEACLYEKYNRDKKWYECGHPEREKVGKE